MYGDTSVIRRLADAMRVRADEVRHLADQLAARAEDVPWQGMAADAMRGRVRDQAGALRRAAVLHDDAAHALDRHAAAVDHVKDVIASIERRAHRLVEAARDRIAGLADRLLSGLGHLVPDPLDELLDRFVPPPHGSRLWLSVDLPGVA